jgi:PST family polysaccharide transporter
MKAGLRNASLLLGGEALSRLFGFLTTALLARRLGLDGFGQVGFALAILAYGISGTDFGLVTVGARSVARDRGAARDLYKRMVPLRALLGIGASGVILAFAFLVPRAAEVRWLLSLYGLGAILQGCAIEWLFIGREQMGLVALSRITATGFYYVLMLWWLRGPSDLMLVPAAFLVSTATGVLVLHLLNLGYPTATTTPAAPTQSWRALLSSAWPIGLAGLLTQAHVNVGLVLLGSLRGFTETGVFAGAYRLVFFLMTLDRVFYTAFLPVMSRYLAARRAEVGQLAGTVLRLVLALTLPLCIGAVLLAGPLVELVLGVSFAPAADPLRLMVWFLPISMLNSLAGYTLVSAGQERRFLRNVAIGTSISIGLSVTGVMVAAGTGAAAALTLGEVAILAVMLPDFISLARPRIDARLAAPLVAALLMVPAMLVLDRLGWFAAAAGGAAVYGAALLLGRGLTASDIGLSRGRST